MSKVFGGYHKAGSISCYEMNRIKNKIYLKIEKTTFNSSEIMSKKFARHIPSYYYGTSKEK